MNIINIERAGLIDEFMRLFLNCDALVSLLNEFINLTDHETTRTEYFLNLLSKQPPDVRQYYYTDEEFIILDEIINAITSIMFQELPELPETHELNLKLQKHLKKYNNNDDSGGLSIIVYIIHNCDRRRKYIKHNSIKKYGPAQKEHQILLYEILKALRINVILI